MQDFAPNQAMISLFFPLPSRSGIHDGSMSLPSSMRGASALIDSAVVESTSGLLRQVEKTKATALKDAANLSKFCFEILERLDRLNRKLDLLMKASDLWIARFDNCGNWLRMFQQVTRNFNAFSILRDQYDVFEA